MRFVSSAEAIPQVTSPTGFSLLRDCKVWLVRLPVVRLDVVNAEFACDFLRLLPERCRFVPLGSLQDYFPFLDSLDIGIAPLLPCAYNRCRPNAKFMVYASPRRPEIR